ncbi:hypothetical protein ABZX77_07920 [Streptomyces sp. NPDC004237]|uniref:hypothetical protein n=1 Tax=Streptomyces sp. NPDC004237 TaxID=3154455 RepID=UPI0033B19DDC
MNDAITAALQRAASHQRRFDARFAAYFDSLTDPTGGTLEIPPHGAFPARALELVRELSPRGGKRRRVALLHEAAALATDEAVSGLDEAAVGIELLQTPALIPRRRHRRRPRTTWRPLHLLRLPPRVPDRPETALALAVLAATWRPSCLCGSCSTAACPPPRPWPSAAVHADAGAATMTGQILDLERDFYPAPDTGLRHTVTEYKSTRYSVLAPQRRRASFSRTDIHHNEPPDPRATGRQALPRHGRHQPCQRTRTPRPDDSNPQRGCVA